MCTAVSHTHTHTQCERGSSLVPLAQMKASFSLRLFLQLLSGESSVSGRQPDKLHPPLSECLCTFMKSKQARAAVKWPACQRAISHSSAAIGRPQTAVTAAGVCVGMLLWACRYSTCTRTKRLFPHEYLRPLLLTCSKQNMKFIQRAYSAAPHRTDDLCEGTMTESSSMLTLIKGHKHGH